MIPATDLFGPMTEFAALRAAALRAARGHRASAEAASFLCELEGNVLELQRRLRGGSWTPAAMRRFSIRDPKPRQI
ncbi:MAG TPA: RNA-dependent DNA polymerase, partial [Myxococcota bacterium]|nr:RNA-dependent DNA polymerase [Myxococcota bacterium]